VRTRDVLIKAGLINFECPVNTSVRSRFPGNPFSIGNLQRSDTLRLICDITVPIA
jgi:hypothetical protein